MLMGYAQVSSNGTYTKQDGAEKVAYGIMLDVRARICINSAYILVYDCKDIPPILFLLRSNERKYQ